MEGYSKKWMHTGMVFEMLAMESLKHQGRTGKAREKFSWSDDDFAAILSCHAQLVGLPWQVS